MHFDLEGRLLTRNTLYAAAIVVLLSSIGASCVNDDFLVVLNLSPIVGKYRIPAGNDTSFSGTIIIRLDSLVSPEYKSSLKRGRVYDVKIRAEGEYAGSIACLTQVRIGSGPVDNLVRFPASGSTSWSIFRNTQSLLGVSPYLAPDPAGISQLLHALTSVPLPSITLIATGHLNVAPVPDNLYVVVEVYLQADAELN